VPKKIVVRCGVSEADVRVEAPPGFEVEVRSFKGEKLGPKG